MKTSPLKKTAPKEMLILVDDNDNPQGEKEKLQVHLDGLKHRAFSVFIYNRYGQMLLQKRSSKKYHSAGLWSNSCCGHPLSSSHEPVIEAAKHRLREELGFTCDLVKVAEISYDLSVGNNLRENEYTHVFAGVYHDDIIPDPAEVSKVSWVGLESLRKNLYDNPQNYSSWFVLYAEEHYSNIILAAYSKAIEVFISGHKV
jgi:isopentenyl-diphosphate Delta-isomerase